MDDYCSPELAWEVYERASGPRRLVWLEIGRHVDLYDQPGPIGTAVEHIAAFLTEHLRADGR
jgi:fermentation-respiration switch protein FrsA (DUF1100 family)